MSKIHGDQYRIFCANPSSLYSNTTKFSMVFPNHIFCTIKTPSGEILMEGFNYLLRQLWTVMSSNIEKNRNFLGEFWSSRIPKASFLTKHSFKTEIDFNCGIGGRIDSWSIEEGRSCFLNFRKMSLLALIYCILGLTAAHTVKKIICFFNPKSRQFLSGAWSN